MIDTNAPPMTPSHDLFGEIRGNSLRCPNQLPKQYAPESLDHININMDNENIGLYNTPESPYPYDTAKNDNVLSRANGNAMYSCDISVRDQFIKVLLSLKYNSEIIKYIIVRI